MPNIALCVGMTYGSELAGSDVDAYNMAGLAGQLGIENVETLTDAYTSVVTRDDVLNSLRSMVDNAQPGDNLLFSFSGMGGQSPDATGAEADGQNEFLTVSDGAITDDEIRAILADLTADVNCTMVMDAGHTGTIGDLDLSGSDIAGNVVCLSSTNDAGTASLADAMGSPFTNAVVNVMTDSANSGVSWADAAALIDAELGNDEPTVVASANRTERTGGDGARDVANEHDDAGAADPADEMVEVARDVADEHDNDSGSADPADEMIEVSRDVAPTADEIHARLDQHAAALDPHHGEMVDTSDFIDKSGEVRSSDGHWNVTMVGVDTNGDSKIDVLAWTDHDTGLSSLSLRDVGGSIFHNADVNHDGLVDSNYTAGGSHVLIPAGMNIAAYVSAQHDAGMDMPME
ncbi:hypothetical protein H9P43_007082 [Blastocladiella emersonii ATCC 22665]|nr:hypothetical protein H9P43_007082 [Blastocladiella emersonii ATCC 22665]